MWSRLQSEAASSSQPAQDSRREISQAWNSLNQTKAALRHIENRLQATPGGAVRLELLQDAKKSTVDRRKRSCRDANHVEQSGSKSRSRSRRSSDKTSRSPLRNSSLDHNARNPSCVEPREPLASFRDAASPHPVVHANSHPDAEVGSSQPSSSDSRTRVARLAETESTSSTQATPLRYLNDFTLHQPDQDASGSEVRPRLQHSDASQPTERRDLEEAEERPVGVGSAGHTTTVKVRTVGRAPPAPAYKGFSSNNRSVRTSEAAGSVWEEEEFQKYSREVYRDLTQQLTGGSSKAKLRPAEPARVKEKKPSKLVRKVHRSSPAPDSSPKPVINTSAWREGQKLIKMVLGPSHTPRPDPAAQSADTPTEPGPAPRVGSAPPPRTSGHQEQMLSANIRSILDDLQMDRGSQQAPGARKSRSTSPAQTSRRREAPVSAAQKKRHYDAEAVRLYISQKQEERRRQQAEERQAQREEEEKKSKRLQELYRRQRAAPVKEAPIQKQLQETYTRLLLEQSQLREDLSITQQVRPVYQPSGESDKENKRHERPHSATSSSDRSFTEQRQPSFSRSDWPQTDPRLSTGSRGSRTPSSGHILSRLIEHDPEPSSGPDRDSQPALVPLPEEAMIKMSRIEALRATAASLSCRLESEARRLAAAGRPVESISVPVSVNKPAAPVPQNQVELVEKLQELLAAGQATHTCAQAPGDTHQASSSHEAQEELSDGSISEGLLSEDSASDQDLQDLQELQELPRSSGRLITAGFAPDTLTHFQKEAEKHKPFSPAAPPRDAHGAWEELAKGSPHSAINIFIKNMQGFVKEREGKACLALGSVDGVVYEDDFNSCASSRSASRRSLSRHGQSHGAFSPPVETLSGRSARFDKDEERSQRSQTLTPLSSHSLCSAAIASEKSGLKEARSTSALSDLLAGGLMKSSSEKSSSRASDRSLAPECSPGGTSARSIYRYSSVGEQSPHR